MRPLSSIAPGWWDFTTLDRKLLERALKLTEEDIKKLERPGFKIVFYDDLESFFLAEALEYINCWKKSTADNPTGICGPIGPTEQLPLVARIINDLEIDVREGHFWAMDEWFLDGKEVPVSNPLSFTRADLELCFNRIRKDLRMSNKNLHFLRADNLDEYTGSYNQAQCLIMQGGQGEVKHWAFNDPVQRSGKYSQNPPSPQEFKELKSRVVELHPLTLIQNARTSGKGAIFTVPDKAITVGPQETFKSKKISIWLPGMHDNSFGIRLSSLMISEKIIDTAVPISLLADHPDVQFNFY
ncbi:MAG: glucosamine-6-phosphate isomerase, partial [Actinobacteria bacterium]|nr:glucosamine-6-phosphate isomerase [Actinomycetota bacterium]